MKYLKFCAVLALLLVLTDGCAPASAPPDTAAQVDAEPSATATSAQAEDDSPWEAVLEAEVDQSMRTAAFLNENFGLTGGAGSPGRAQLTNDGETWTLAESSLG